MCRFWRFLSVLFLTCCVGISGVVTPARAESVIDMCEKCSYAIWFNANVSNADKCDDYANYGTSLNTLCRNTYNSSSNVTSTCQSEGSECVSGGNGAYCESGKFGSPLQEGNSCTVGTQTGTYQSGCCTNLSDPAPTCYHGTCSSDSDCTTGAYTECNTTTGCCQEYSHYYWCDVGTTVNTNYANCTVLDNQGDFTGYPGTQSSAFAACRTSGTTYKIAYHSESTASGACVDRNGNEANGYIGVYSVTSCNTCSSGTRVSYQWAMDHRSFYGISNMLCSDENASMHAGTSFDDIYVCVNCTSGAETNWTDVSGQNYQSATYKNCANATRTTYYRCKKNYYSAGGYGETDDPSKLNCQPCPPIGNMTTYTDKDKEYGASSISGCCAPSGATDSDTLGSFRLKSECCW